MSYLIALQILTASLTRRARSGVHRRLGDVDREAGLTTLEITIIALGLFVLAGAAVLALTTATDTRLNQIR